MNTNRVSQRGGAQVGWLSASWPFASIKIEPGSLVVNALGEYAFKPSEVRAIEPVGSIPILTTGVRVHHTRSGYPEKIVFYSMAGRERLLTTASSAGFTVGVPTIQTKRGFPVKVSAIVVFVLLWNLLFLLDSGGNVFPSSRGLGPYSFVALAMAFAVATLTPRSSHLQRFILRDGHDVGEIRGFLRLLQIVSALLALATGMSLWSR